MGVTVLLQYPIAENKTGPQTADQLIKRIGALGALQSGQFLVDCETYSSVPSMGGPPRTVHVLHNSEQPAAVFALLESPGPPPKTVPLVADGLFDLLMIKMGSIYQNKKQIRMEARGARFELGDFFIKIGTVTMGQNFKGVLVEVEYRPCSIPANCWDLLREFMQSFLGSVVQNSPPPYFQIQNKLNEVYQPLDTIQQYLDHFSSYRKVAGL
ncbi:mediator of RNA polymerase II transcription subunit 20 [Neocloeon triangulifer]|uniref:mediator of RNA polymerase II transcription subunit 20 n=1 Tax=Neocloeon triangulifer TaxID=2078957 RepID=UPI00286F0029|nr:mediator of RNA polymerase II transcription subunit 20 [Neocloeon triangulifer]